MNLLKSILIIILFSVIVVGQNAVISGDTSLTVNSSGESTGNLDYTDVDDTDDVWQLNADVTQTDGGTSYGTLSIDADGNLSFTNK